MSLVGLCTNVSDDSSVRSWQLPGPGTPGQHCAPTLAGRGARCSEAERLVLLAEGAGEHFRDHGAVVLGRGPDEVADREPVTTAGPLRAGAEQFTHLRSPRNLAGGASLVKVFGRVDQHRGDPHFAG